MKPVILVIEDSKTHLKVISSLLEEFGYSVLYAENDQEAFQFARNHKPDLILLDLSLPGVGGLEVCRNLSQDHETGQIPIFILTQKRKIEDKITAFKAGVQDYLTRPYHPEELRARIRSVLKIKEHFKVLEKDKQRLEEQMETIQDAASRDSLTALLSRKRFLNSLKIEFIRSIRYHLPLTLCAFDIDQFRLVNSQFGELSGDIVLAGIADLIKDNFREIDFHSRIDQDHFLA
ncbi:MAG: response regulator, partial [Nitrospirae bacterium]|nr:response regulator [Nitrospirota bacterium]